MRSLFLALLLLAGIGAGGYYYWTRQFSPVGSAAQAEAPQAAADPAGQEIPVEAAKVKVGPIAREIIAVGTLRSNESVTIRPEIAGRIGRILFTEGQRVTKGQPLVKLDDVQYGAQLAQAEANLALSQANSERAQQLYRQGAGTERARDEAEARLRVDQATVLMARTMLDKTLISAPFDGILGLRNVSVGAYVTPGQDIVGLDDIDPVKVDFRVPELLLASVLAGQNLSLQVDAFPDRRFSGAVYAIDPQIDENGRSILLRARVPNGELLLRPGLFARVRLVLEEKPNALMVPEEALIPRGNEVSVFRVVDGRATPTQVRTGKRRGGQVEIVEGLSAEDMVVTAGQMKLRPGAAVRLVGKDKA